MVGTWYVRIDAGVLSPLKPLVCMLIHGHIPQKLSAHSLVLLKEHLSRKLIRKSDRLLGGQPRVNPRYSVDLRLHDHEILDDLGSAHLMIMSVIYGLNLTEAGAELKRWRWLHTPVMSPLNVMTLGVQDYGGRQVLFVGRKPIGLQTLPLANAYLREDQVLPLVTCEQPFPLRLAIVIHFILSYNYKLTWDA